MVPTEIDAHGKTVPLSSPLYKQLVEIMTMMPASIGDFMSHPDGQNYLPQEIVDAVQILVACGIARPMRGGWHNEHVDNVVQPRLAGSFNQ